jgi:dihydroorotase
MMPLLMARVLDGKISLQSVIEKTSYKPAELLGIPGAGFSTRDRADFAIYPKIPCPITTDMLHSKCDWTPFEGHMSLFPAMVIMGGKIVYHDGEFFTPEPRWFAGKGLIKRS